MPPTPDTAPPLLPVTVPFIKEKLHDKGWLNNFVSVFLHYCIKYVGSISLAALIVLLAVNHFIQNEFLYYIILSIPILFITILNSFCYGILNSLNKFNTAAMPPFTRAIIIFIVIYFFNAKLGIVAVILGYNLGELFKFLQLLYIIIKLNHIKISIKTKDYSLIKSFIKEGSFQVISTSISCASPLIDKIVASFLVVGSLSVLDYGDKVTLIFNITLNAFLVVVLSKWSVEFVQKTFQLKAMNKILLAILCFSSIVLVGVIIVKTPLTNILYPTLSADKRHLISWIIVINMLGFVFNSVNQVINIANIAFKATSVLVKTSMIKAVINLVFDIILGWKFGVIGIVISTVFVHFSGLLINYFMFKSKVWPRMSTLQV